MNYVWVTLDGISVYSCILHHVAINLVQYMYKTYSKYLSELYECIILSIEFILLHNYFSFNEKKNSADTRSACRFSPSLSNLVVSFWKEVYIFLYGRYIDDPIFIWGWDVVSIPHFMEYVHLNDSNLKFAGNFSNTTMNFLDLTLTGDILSSEAVTSIYRKLEAGNSTSSPDSSHTKQTIPMDEFIRV